MTAQRRFATAAELAVLEHALPVGLAEGMRELALCMYEALVLTDVRAGTAAPAGQWAEQLATWARLVLAQLQHLAQEMGGRGGLYIAKGLVAQISARDHEMCAKFKGNNYRELAHEYGLTEMRVRQIVDAWQRQRFAARQGVLPGLDAA
ncbi:MAG: Mor transcription activator family protein [Roseateles sp.]|uniref:Mor transcription activator family protein n=1 Tax=Roseateles sp. TaxID=1971397 RepID=UPI0039EA85AA